MKKNTDLFTPDQIDEQIEERLSAGAGPSASTRLLQDIQRRASSAQEQDRQLLQRAWQRIEAHRSGVPDARRLPLHLTRFRRRHQMQQQERQLSLKRSLAQRLGMLAAVLVATLVVGGMLAVFLLVRSSHQTTQTTASQTIIQQNKTPQEQKFQMGKTPAGIYTGSSRLDAASGRSIWNFHLTLQGSDPTVNHSMVQESNAIVNQTIVQDGLSFVISQDDLVYAVNATTGKLVWETEVPVNLYKNVQEINSTLYLLNRNGNLLALSATTGKLLSTSQEHFDNFSIANGILYGSHSATLTAVQLSQNKQLWQAQGVEGQTLDLPHVVDGKLYITSTSYQPVSSFIYGFDASTGKALWPAQKFRGAIFGVTVAHGTLYFGVFGSALYALDAATGQPIWHNAFPYHPIGTPALAGPLVEGNLIYALFNPATTSTTGLKENGPTGIAILDATTGALKGTAIPDHGAEIDTFTVHSGTLYLGLIAKIVAMKADGKILWTVDDHSGNDIAAIFS